MTDDLKQSSSKATIVRINVEPGNSGLLFAKSPDLKGLLVAERTMEELEREIPIAIAALYEAAGERVTVIQAEDLGEDNPVMSWVKLPAPTQTRAQFA